MNLMISMRKVTKRGEAYQVEGSSDTYETIDEAIKYIRSSEKAKKSKKKEHVFRFFSEKLNKGFRSSWEVELAELLTSLEIKWEYEPKRFYFRAERESYLPDFFLPEYNCWIEVKGWMDKRSEKRCRLFKKYHSRETAFFLFMKEERALVLRNPELIWTYIEIATNERRRTK